MGKIKEIIKLLDIVDLKQRPQLIMMTMDELKDSVEKGGKPSIDVSGIVHDMDKLIRKLMYEIRHRNLSDIVNIMIISDTGISKLDLHSGVEILSLEELLNNKDTKQKLIKRIDNINIHEGKLISLKIKDINDRNQIFKRLKMNIEPDEISLYIKDNLPSQYHFNINKYDGKKKDVIDSIDDIWLIPHEGYSIVVQEKEKEKNKKNVNNGINLLNEKSIFIGQGPFFQDIIQRINKNNRYFSQFNNIALYDIISCMIGLNGKDRNKARDGYRLGYTSTLTDYTRESGGILGGYESDSSSAVVISTTSSITKASTSVGTITSTVTTSSSVITSSSTILTRISSPPSTKVSNKFGDKINSMIDYLKDTEEELVDDITDMVNDLLGSDII